MRRMVRWVRTAGVGLVLAGGQGCYWGCFGRGTRVWTPRGARRIEQLRVGDEVWSWDLVRGEAVARRIAGLRERRALETLRFAVGELVIAEVTAVHPFWDAVSGEWREVGTLGAEARVLVWLGAGRARELGNGRITRTQHVQAVAVYDLTVDGEEHNFFAEGVLVHNKSPPLQPLDQAQSLDLTNGAGADMVILEDLGIGDGGDDGTGGDR